MESTYNAVNSEQMCTGLANYPFGKVGATALA